MHTSPVIAQARIVSSLSLIFVSTTVVEAKDAIRPADRPAIILAFDNTGDFGPGTEGTKTDGWQEALDFCVSHARDLYVKGGFGGRKAVYHIAETIRIPAAQDFRIDGGVYVVNFRGSDPSMHAVVIDSAMNCEYKLGLIVYGGNGAGLQIAPTNPVPIDGFPAFIETTIRSQGIADPNPFKAGERKAGTGLVVNASGSDVAYSDFYFAAVLNFATNIRFSGKKRFYSNEFVCEHLHTNAHNSELLDMGSNVSTNRFRFGIGVDQGATGVRGILVSGRNNVLSVSTRPGGFEKGAQVVFRRDSRDNQLNLRTEEDPLTLITDDAEVPTNQTTWTGRPAAIRSVTGTSSEFVYTQRLYPAVVTVNCGELESLIFERGDDQIEYDSQRCDILMSAGDRLRIKSRDAPILQIVPLKTR